MFFHEYKLISGYYVCYERGREKTEFLTRRKKFLQETYFSKQLNLTYSKQKKSQQKMETS